MALLLELESKESECASRQSVIDLCHEASNQSVNKKYAKQLLDQAKILAKTPHDYINVAETAVALGEINCAENLYLRAESLCFEAMEFATVGRSLAIHTGNSKKAKVLLERAAVAANKTDEFLLISGYAVTDLKDEALAAQLLAKADEQAKTPDDYRKLMSSLFDSDSADKTRMNKDDYGVDVEWILPVESRQDVYFSFQQREKAATTFTKLLLLADDVMLELDDRSYVRQLLMAADRLNDEEGFSVIKAQALVLLVCEHLADFSWGESLLRKAIAQAKDLTTLSTLSLTAIRHMAESGKDLAKLCLLTWQQRLAESKMSNAYDYTRLSECVYRDLSDVNWAKDLLAKAEAIGGDLFFWAHMAKIAATMSDQKLSTAYLQKAIAQSATPEHAMQLATRLLQDGSDNKQVRDAYLQTRINMQSTRDELAWTENIIVLFRDADWVLQAYDELAPRMVSINEKRLFNFSRHVRLDFQMKAI